MKITGKPEPLLTNRYPWLRNCQIGAILLAIRLYFNRVWRKFHRFLKLDDHLFDHHIKPITKSQFVWPFANITSYWQVFHILIVFTIEIAIWYFDVLYVTLAAKECMTEQYFQTLLHSKALHSYMPVKSLIAS